MRQKYTRRIFQGNAFSVKTLFEVKAYQNNEDPVFPN